MKILNKKKLSMFLIFLIIFPTVFSYEYMDNTQLGEDFPLETNNIDSQRAHDFLHFVENNEWEEAYQKLNEIEENNYELYLAFEDTYPNMVMFLELSEGYTTETSLPAVEDYFDTIRRSNNMRNQAEENWDEAEKLMEEYEEEGLISVDGVDGQYTVQVEPDYEQKLKLLTLDKYLNEAQRYTTNSDLYFYKAEDINNEQLTEQAIFLSERSHLIELTIVVIKAEEMINSNNPDGAANLISEFISNLQSSIYPNVYKEAKLRLADVYHAKGDYEKVIEIYEEIISENPGTELAEKLQIWINTFEAETSLSSLFSYMHEEAMIDWETERPKTLFNYLNYCEGGPIDQGSNHWWSWISPPSIDFTEVECDDIIVTGPGERQLTDREKLKRTYSIIWRTGNIPLLIHETLSESDFNDWVAGVPSKEFILAQISSKVVLDKVKSGQASSITQAISLIKQDKDNLENTTTHLAINPSNMNGKGYWGDINGIVGLDGTQINIVPVINNPSPSHPPAPSDVYNYIQNSPVFDMIVSSESQGDFELDEEAYDKVQIEFANRLREKGFYYNAYQILNPIAEKDTEEGEEARSIIADIEGEGLFNLADTTIDMFTGWNALFTVGDFLNVFSLAAWAGILKVASFGLSSLSVSSPFVTNILGKTSSALRWIPEKIVGGISKIPLPSWRISPLLRNVLAVGTTKIYSIVVEEVVIEYGSNILFTFLTGNPEIGSAAELLFTTLTGGVDSFDAAQMSLRNSFENVDKSMIQYGTNGALTNVIGYNGEIDINSLREIGSVRIIDEGLLEYTNRLGETVYFAKEGLDLTNYDLEYRSLSGNVYDMRTTDVIDLPQDYDLYGFNEELYSSMGLSREDIELIRDNFEKGKILVQGYGWYTETELLQQGWTTEGIRELKIYTDTFVEDTIFPVGLKYVTQNGETLVVTGRVLIGTSTNPDSEAFGGDYYKIVEREDGSLWVAKPLWNEEIYNPNINPHYDQGARELFTHNVFSEFDIYSPMIEIDVLKNGEQVYLSEYVDSTEIPKYEYADDPRVHVVNFWIRNSDPQYLLSGDQIIPFDNELALNPLYEPTVDFRAPFFTEQKDISEFQSAIREIQQFASNEDNLRQLVESAGFEHAETEEIIKFLQENADNLDTEFEDWLNKNYQERTDYQGGNDNYNPGNQDTNIPDVSPKSLTQSQVNQITSGASIAGMWSDTYDRIVYVDVDKVDNLWQYHWNYISEGGTKNAKSDGTYNRLREDFLQGEKLQNLPVMAFNENGQLYIEDGRHRFSALRDLGATKIPVGIKSDQLYIFQDSGFIVN